ncbi:MAG TPA: hypothetical protein VFA10_15990 [Ktedonobacteraceae bacterium]|jgi:hypothetical protein|nr:hypothetical protein [Ktedonobacteraceae bacterium]
MKTRRNVITDPVVRAIDRASQAEYRLRALIDRVEEAIEQDRDRIRLACPLEGGLSKMSNVLLRYLQQEQTKVAQWASIAQGCVLDLINVKKLARSIWPELKQSKNRK